MRTNLPITDREHVLEDGKTIVSTTDMKGNITYANPYFIEISGFAEHELLGAPQNILRRGQAWSKIAPKTATFIGY